MKINLIRRARSRKKQKSNNKLEKKVWYITKKQQDIRYYLHQINKNTKAVEWTVHVNEGMQFHTENGVQTFHHAHLNNRTDVECVALPESG